MDSRCVVEENQEKHAEAPEPDLPITGSFVDLRQIRYLFYPQTQQEKVLK